MLQDVGNLQATQANVYSDLPRVFCVTLTLFVVTKWLLFVIELLFNVFC